jgi:hypothetical protein
MTDRFRRPARLAAIAISIVASCASAAVPARSQDAPGCPSGYSPAGAGCISERGRTSIERFRPIQAIRYVLGSKRLVGYFVAANGECLVTLMIAEDVDAMVGDPLPAARLVLSLRPGQSADLDSPDSETMRLTCHGEGDTVEVAVRRRNVTAADRSTTRSSLPALR